MKTFWRTRLTICSERKQPHRSRPKAGLEVYEDIKQTWDHEGFQTVMDYLHYYNNLDVYPLHKAVTQMARFFEQHSIDLLKETLTLSGAANKILHRSNIGDGIFCSIIKTRICIKVFETILLEGQV